LKILIKNGTIVNEGLSYVGSIFINNELIEDVTSDKEKVKEYACVCDEVIDATGLYVMPGVIDDQVHFREPGATQKGSISTESAAAVLGGVTSYLDMPNNNPPICSLVLLENKFHIAAKESYANYSFYFGANNDNIDQIIKIDKRRVCGVKVFMGSSTGNMLVDNPMTLALIFSQAHVPIATHCEDEKIIRSNLKAAIGKYGDDIPISEHPNIRSREACISSTRKAINLALHYKSRLHILHISTKEEIDMIRVAKTINPKITGEICVHYLWFCDKDYEYYGAKMKCNPAIKTEADMYALRSAVRDGIISVVATDHAPHLEFEKDNLYVYAPSGMPLIQNSLQMMLELCKNGVFNIEDVVDRMSHSPAKCFDIYNRGYIRPGYFADIAIVNYNKDNIVVPAYKCGWSLFSHFSTSVVHTFVNGTQVVKNGELTGLKPAKELAFNR